ncbi:MAG: mandelate racemase/muconate lactonizing enzyme family protein [Bacteroidota bacterium]
MLTKNTRRNFFKTATLGIAASAVACKSNGYNNRGNSNSSDDAVRVALAQPVLKRALFPDPVVLDRVELLRFKDNFICRVTSTDGAEGIAVSNNDKMIHLYPIFTKRIQPFFMGKDARDWEALLEEVYVYKSNYKLQNLALWVPLATLEFAVLDLLGKIANRPIGALIGDIHHEEIAVYRANNFRGKSAEASIALIKEQVERTQAKALKFKVGGRMSKNKDFPADRSEKLIPLVRKTFGDEMTIYADSNGSYDVEEAIHIGRIMQEYQYDFYEEPVPFDWYEETKAVTDALKVPVAGGEQEPSMRTFQWLIENEALDILQPDIFYFGGMIRAMKVARMADAKGKVCTPHISGSGLGYLYMMHFVSALPNAGPYHEFKGFNKELPLSFPTSDMRIQDGKVKVPKGAGLGVLIDPDYIGKHQVVKG